MVRRMTLATGDGGRLLPSCDPKLSLPDTVGLSSHNASPWDSVLACLAEGRPLAIAFGVCKPAAAQATAMAPQSHGQRLCALGQKIPRIDGEKRVSTVTVRLCKTMQRPLGSNRGGTRLPSRHVSSPVHRCQSPATEQKHLLQIEGTQLLGQKHTEKTPYLPTAFDGASCCCLRTFACHTQPGIWPAITNRQQSSGLEL